MARVQTVTADDAELAVFQTAAGETVALPRPSLSPAEETAFITLLRQILEEEEHLNEQRGLRKWPRLENRSQGHCSPTYMNRWLWE